jgi:hypothetical protein
MELCHECGIAVAETAAVEHVCDPDRRVAFQLHLHRDGIARLERDVRAYMASAAGRFELWYAERERLRRAA